MYLMTLQLTVYCFLLLSCFGKHEDKKDFTSGIVPGASQMALYLDRIQDRKVALVVNHTSVIEHTHLVDTLLQRGVKIQRIFAPEHGFRGKADAGELVKDGIDSASGLPVISLYGKNKKPTQEQLADIDAIVFDIQDVGLRFYTYISTMHYVMEAAAENGIPVIVLDRPNPHRQMIDGPIMENDYTSFVGLHPVPVAYGMTIGEYAQMINGESWLANGAVCDLTVIPCGHYNGWENINLQIPPSPNLPSQQSIALYPSLCFFEGTTISVGRGTDYPFQVLGHPELDSIFSFQFTPKPNEGASNPKHRGRNCYGLDLRAIKPEKTQLDLSYLISMHKACRETGTPFFNENNFFEKLAGTASLRQQITEEWTEARIRESWQPGLDDFMKIRGKYLIYGRIMR